MRIVFIIDELDKLSQYDTVLQVLRIVKTLINNMSATFVFITDEKLYEKISGSISEPNPKDNTLFSQKVFITRPRFVHIRRFFEGIINYDLLSRSGNKTPIIYFTTLSGLDRSGSNLEKGFIHTDEEANILSDLEISKKNKNLLIYHEGELICEAKLENSEIVNSNFSIKNLNKFFYYDLFLNKDRIFIRKKLFTDLLFLITYKSRSDFFTLHSYLKDNIRFNHHDDMLNFVLEDSDEMLILPNLQRAIEFVFLRSS